ncbi:RBP11-like subunits of RNA polymerase, partial [Backusella circina FSU 941]
NVPEGNELFTLPVGKRKVAVELSSPTSARITIEREDHTLGILLKGKLLSYDDVTFAGYIMPHPLDHYFVMNIQTRCTIAPKEALLNSIRQLTKDLQLLQLKLTKEIIQ